ncbi:hypothetical protein J7E29_16740 [Streptomyces sp. ISL-90]|nr:hypothetical protein [Streptomyces sp. ISL-90]
MSDRLLTPDEAAEILDTTPDELRALREAKRGPLSFNITRRTVRYSSKSVHEYRREELQRTA